MDEVIKFGKFEFDSTRRQVLRGRVLILGGEGAGGVLVPSVLLYE